MGHWPSGFSKNKFTYTPWTIWYRMEKNLYEHLLYLDLHLVQKKKPVWSTWVLLTGIIFQNVCLLFSVLVPRQMVDLNIWQKTNCIPCSTHEYRHLRNTTDTFCYYQRIEHVVIEIYEVLQKPRHFICNLKTTHWQW